MKVKKELNRITKKEVDNTVKALKESLKIDQTIETRARITGMVEGLEASLSRSKGEIVELIKELNEQHYVAGDSIKEIILLNKVVGLCASIYADCDQPSCISDTLWSKLKQEGDEMIANKKQLEEFKARMESPKTLRECLAERPEDLKD